VIVNGPKTAAPVEILFRDSFLFSPHVIIIIIINYFDVEFDNDDN